MTVTTKRASVRAMISSYLGNGIAPLPAGCRPPGFNRTGRIAANDNRPVDDTPVFTAAYKARQRAAANDNCLFDDPDKIRIERDDQPIGPLEIHKDKTPDELRAERAAARAQAALRNAVDAAAIATGKQALEARPGRRWDGAANDNAQSWPLLEALRRDGRGDDIAIVRRYRELVRAVETSPYGLDAGGGDEIGVGVEMRSLKLSGEAFDKSFEKMTATNLPGGNISYRETRIVAKGGAGVGQHRQIATDETKAGLMPMKFFGRAGDRISQIDGRPILDELRAAIPDWELLEDAVDGEGLTAIGGRLGYRFAARSREAKLRIYAAIDQCRDAWARIDRREGRRAAECERRVAGRRAELAATRKVPAVEIRRVPIWIWKIAA